MYLELSPPPGPTADFTSSTHDVNIVDFTDTSIGSPTSWLWNFGDGHTSTSQNPTHSYDEGTFTVSLTATAGGVSDTETKVDYIVISFSISEPALSDPFSLGVLPCGEPALAEPIVIGSGTGSLALSEPFVMGTGAGEVALSTSFILKSVDFSASAMSGTAPLSVIFTHINNGIPYDTFFWDFGDGDTSTIANPSHTYLTDGIFTVTLTATSISYGSASNTKVDYINVATSHADFIGTPLSGPTPLGVQFSNASTFPAIAFFWDFGDGDISTIAAPLHIYEEPGKYTVTLIASNPLVGTYTATKVEYITSEMPAPVPAFSVTPIVGFEPSTVSFTNESTGFPSGYLWDFGDGHTSIEESPTHTYVLAGTFTVTLTAYNETAPSGVVSSPVSVMVFPVPDLVADFITGSIVPDVGGVKTYFIDKSKEALSWSWEFGDPTSGVLNTSYAQNPSHVYAIPGVYQITLTVTHGPFSDSICKSVLVTTDILRYMEIWGTARFVDGTPVVADRVVSVGRDITLTEYECGSSATDTFHSYKTINDSGVTRFLVRGRGHVIGIPDSGFEDGAPVYLSISGRQATIQVNDVVVPWSAPFFMTLPSSPTSSIEVDVVFPLATTTIYPEPGIYEDRVEVSFTSNLLPLVIYYTVDGTDPKTSPTRQLYINSFYVEEGATTIKYYSHDTLGADEVTREAVYVVHGPLVSSDPVPSDYSTSLMITLIGNRPGTIYYRLNYTGVYSEYSTPIPLDAGPTGVRTVFIQAYLIDNYSNVGVTQEFEYKIDLLNPTITHYTLSNEDLVTAHQMITVQVDANSYTNTVTGLLLSTYSDFHDASVRLYQPEVTFILPAPDGVKTVYAQVIDQLGCVSSVKSRTIELNTEIPAFTVSSNPGTPIGETTYIFTGTKSANSGIYSIVNGGTEMLIVPFSSNTTWECEISLVEGVNVLQFQAGTVVSNRSSIEIRTIDVRPIPQGVTEATTITKSDGTWRIPFVFFDEKTGEEATADLNPPLKQHHNIKKRQHDFRIRVTSDFGLDPIVTFPTQDLVLTEKVITVRGTATPGSKITLCVERRGKVPA
jgi:PKD repeat protein